MIAIFRGSAALEGPVPAAIHLNTTPLSHTRYRKATATKDGANTKRWRKHLLSMVEPMLKKR